MSLAYGTATATPNGTKPIQNFEIGNSVLAGSPTDKGDIKWAPANVRFSSGTGGGGREIMVFISFDGNEIICTRDQPFLMPDGKLKRADRLAPGVDRLVNAEGNPVEIFQVSVGYYEQGIHGIATDTQFNGSLDNHLLITAGVVTGDYIVERYIDELSKYGLAVEDDGEREI